MSHFIMGHSSCRCCGCGTRRRVTALFVIQGECQCRGQESSDSVGLLGRELRGLDAMLIALERSDPRFQGDGWIPSLAGGPRPAWADTHPVCGSKRIARKSTRPVVPEELGTRGDRARSRSSTETAATLLRIRRSSSLVRCAYSLGSCCLRPRPGLRTPAMS